jgi:hypothetical protein
MFFLRLSRAVGVAGLSCHESIEDVARRGPLGAGVPATSQSFLMSIYFWPFEADMFGMPLSDAVCETSVRTPLRVTNCQRPRLGS